MRVGIIALQHESNTFLLASTTLEDFQRGILASGENLLRHYADSHHEVGGFIQGIGEQNLTLVPIFAAWATPGGTITADTYRALHNLLFRALEAAGSLDGLLVAPHGAGVCESEPDMDGHWLSALRQRVGPDVPIICTLDLHANLSQRMVDACDATIAYRTNPHLDQHDRGLEAARLLARTLRGEIRPVQGTAFPAMAINIAAQQTDAAPCSRLIAQLDTQLRLGLLSNSAVLGFPYADVPEMGSSFIAVTDNDPALAQRAASEMADWLMTHRQDFLGDLFNIEQAVERAMMLQGPVCLLDVGDNVGGGSPGDGTLIVHALHARRIRSFVCLYDPAAAQRAAGAGIGQSIELEMGGHTDDLHGPPLRTVVTIVSLHDGRFTETQPRHGGRLHYDMGKTAIVRTVDGLTIQLTSRRTPPFSLNQLLSCGIDPAGFRVLVAKGVNAPIAAYQPVCRHILRVNTPGVTTADMTQLPFRNRRRPMFPFEPV